MKRLALVLALGVAGAPAALAQPAPGTTAMPGPAATTAPYSATGPAMPQLDAAKSAEVQRQIGLYRTEIDGRVARGEITAAEAERLLQWREWQIARQVAGLAPPPGPVMEEVPVPVVREYYRPYYAYPYYYGPAYYPSPYYFGARVCAGGWGRHFGGRFCF